MIIRIFILLLALCVNADAEIYCINKATGSDSNTGIASGSGSDCTKCDSGGDSVAWQNASKLDTFTFAAGDYVCGNKGESHELTTSISFNSSGTSGSFVSLTDWNVAGTWTNEGNDVWSTTFSEYPKRIKLSSTEYSEAQYVNTFTDDNGTIYQGVDSTYRWAWRPIEHTAATMKLYIYATSNPASFYSNIEYEDTSGYITIGTYGTGAKPIIECQVRISGSDTSGNWSDATADGAPTNTWKMTGVSTSPRRVWFDGTEKPSADRITTGGTDPHRIGATYPWFHTGTTLYVYSAGGNPASTITLMEGNGTCSGILSLTNRSNIIVDGWEFRNGQNNVIAVRASSNIIIQNNTIGYGGYGVIATGGAAASYIKNSKILIRDNYFDHGQRWMVDVGTNAVGYDDMSGVADGIHFRESCEWCSVYRNVIANYDHCGVTLETTNSTSLNFTNGDYHNKIFSNEIHSANNYDGRCFTTYGRLGKNTFNEFFYNDCHDVTAQSKLDGGPGNHVHHNFFHTGRNPYYNSTNTQGISEFIVYICLSTDEVSTSNLLENNIFYDNDEPAIRVDQQSSGSCTKENHIIRNNIFINNGTDSQASSIVGDFVQMQIEVGSNVGANIYKNNLFYHTLGTATVAYGGVYNGSTPYSISAFNALDGTDGNDIGSNLIGDPEIVSLATSDLHIPSSSPAKNTGLTSYVLYDWYGDEIQEGTTDIGISEYQDEFIMYGIEFHGASF